MKKYNLNTDEISAFETKIYIKDGKSLLAGYGFNADLLNLLGDKGKDWFNETVNLIIPLMTQQATKFNRLFKEKLGAEQKSLEIAPLKDFDEMMEDDDDGE